jgi:hypothetical protein
VEAPIFDSQFTIHAEHPAYARKIIRATLSGAHSDVVEDAALLTSELVADAMMRPDADPELFINAGDGHIYVEVRASDFTSQHRDRVRLSEWVLLIMNALASSWGIESRGGGRVVWFDLSL